MLQSGWLMLGHPIETDSHWAIWPLKTLDAKVMAWYRVQFLQI